MESTFESSEFPKSYSKWVATDTDPLNLQVAGCRSGAAGVTVATGAPGSSLPEAASLPQRPWSGKGKKH